VTDAPSPSSANLPWGQVERHAIAQIELTRDALERAPADQVPRFQAEIAVWRRVLALPATLGAVEIDDIDIPY
jgi:hypothetical protein